MDVNNCKSVYFLGIGGIGMSALAKYFLNRGVQVSGYDLTPSILTETLQTLGAHIHFDESVKQIPENTDLVIYTPAVPKTHPAYAWFEQRRIPMYKRAQILGHLTENKITFAIAGTHGKTTTTSMVAHLLSGKEDVTAFIGGIAKNFNDNFVDHSKSEIIVVEADEFDRSFLTLFPNFAVITSMDADHLDIYGTPEELRKSFLQFANQTKKGGHIIVNQSIERFFEAPKIVYGLDKSCDFYATNITETHGKYAFDLYFKDQKISRIRLSVVGKHNMENAVAAGAAGFLYGLDSETIRTQLETFTGVARRFDYHIDREDLIYIDDYAHHPTEIKATMTALRTAYPDKTLTLMFQPHLYSRTRDFMDEFAESLALTDELILLPIYPAREQAEQFPGISSQVLLEKVKLNHKYLLEKSEVINHLKTHPPQVLVTLGAGDIDRLVIVIKNLFKVTRPKKSLQINT